MPTVALAPFRGSADFVAAVLDRSPFYRCADPVVPCMLTVCRAADELGWHYDPNDSLVS